ncbi:HNH endonuclease [uncultured Streptococcus sp.]|uniref:HNH endonuclease n=1 Tax=uncultured Streptococcus sp. TaxID=83427 RepID=UPI0028E29B5B|nr:HNH endonuclease [uncultured Streptococcus sp.]
MSEGFYVDVDELYTVFEELQSQSEKIIASLEAAKSSYNSVITSNSMYGDVGQAIAGEINSSHNMLLMQLKDLLYSLQSDFSKEVESFQSATGEKSSTAIISHSYLKSTSEYFDTLKGEIDQIRKTINSATDSVSDLVSVTSDAKNYEYFGGNLSNAKDVVTNTIEKVSAWDSQGTALTTETSLQNLQELLGQLHQTDGLDYSDPIISQVVNNLSPIADKVKEIDDQIDESVQKAKLEAQKAKELEEKERDRIEKDWRLHHPIQATLRDWRKGVSDFLDEHTSKMKRDPNWKWLKGFGDAAFGAVGDAVFGVLEFGVDLVQYSTEGVILGYNSLMGNETPQWMKDDLQGGIETFGNVILNTLGNAFGLVTMIPEVNNLINDLDDSTRDGSIMGAILHDVRHAKDLKQQPIRDKINLVGKFSGYESGHAAGEIVSEIVSWIGPAKLAKMAGGGKLVSRLAQMPKIQKGISYFKKARTMLANSHLGMLARESYGATKDFFTSRLGNLWDDFSRKRFAFVSLDKFRYGDDIGKHTARLYQSTSEGAEYQRIRQGLYSEAAEHGDDVAKGVKEAGEKNATYPSTYDERINQTPVNNGSWTGDRGESKFISELDEVNDVLKKYDIDGIEYKDGIPDFSPVSEGEVIHPDMSIDRNKNFRVADELLAEQLGVSRKEITKLRKQGKFTWHELNDMKTMQLIPSILNSKFGHLGGVAEVKKLLGL